MKHASVSGLPVVLPSGIYHLPSGILFSIFVWLSKTTLQLSPSQHGRADLAGQAVYPLSADQLTNRLAAIDDLHRTAPRSRVLGLDVDPHGLGHSRDQIHDADRSVRDVHAVLVSRTHGLPPFDAAAANRDRPTARPVIAAGVLVDLGGASKLSHPDDQRAIEQPALCRWLNILINCRPARS